MQARTGSRTATAGVPAVLAAAALAVLGGCSGPGSGTAADGPGPSGGASSPAAMPPGRYQTLPEPCGSVSGATLKFLLPASKDYAGTPAPTFDTDRRVGCSWTGTAAGEPLTLRVDLERVVSYDPSVSDEERAHADFTDKARAAHIPDTPPSPGDDLDDTATPQPGDSAFPGADASQGTDTAPRRISGLGDEAYINDTVDTAHPSQTAAGREVTVVFRTSNVLVTIDYTRRSTTSAPPPGFELQVGAHGLAQELAKTIAQ